MREVVTIRGPVDVECQCAAWCPRCVLVGLMFFSLELSLSRMASQSHSRSWSVTSAHVQGRLKRKIKHLMSEMNSQPQQLCFHTYQLTCTESPQLLSSESDLTRSRSAQAPHLVDLVRSNCFSLVVSRRLLVWSSAGPWFRALCLLGQDFSFAERVGCNTVHTLPAILIVAHCSLCRTQRAYSHRRPYICSSHVGRVIFFGFHCEGVGNREHVMRQPTLVISSSSGRDVLQDSSHNLGLQAKQLPCVKKHVSPCTCGDVAPTSRLARPCVHASRPLPKAPTGKLHPERLHNRYQRCHSQVRITTEPSCESREQVVYGCPVVDATVPTIAARRHQGRAAFRSN